MDRSLNPIAIVETIETSKKRIEERFPNSGLARVASELLDVGRAAQNRVEGILPAAHPAPDRGGKTNHDEGGTKLSKCAAVIVGGPPEEHKELEEPEEMVADA